VATRCPAAPWQPRGMPYGSATADVRTVAASDVLPPKMVTTAAGLVGILVAIGTRCTSNNSATGSWSCIVGSHGLELVRTTHGRMDASR